MSKKINILVVDDERIVLDSIKKLLRNEEYSIYTVFSVKNALEEIKKTKIDVILTYLMMPYFEGLYFMKIIKKKLSKHAGNYGNRLCHN